VDEVAMHGRLDARVLDEVSALFQQHGRH
jgi:hypothetical protein